MLRQPKGALFFSIYAALSFYAHVVCVVDKLVLIKI